MKISLVPFPHLTTLLQYRPISLLHLISKVIENVIHYQVSTFLNSKNCLYTSQFVFRKKNCTDLCYLSILSIYCKHPKAYPVEFNYFLKSVKDSMLQMEEHSIKVQSEFKLIKNITYNLCKQISTVEQKCDESE